MQDPGGITTLESTAHDTYDMRYTHEPAVQDNVPTFIDPTAIFDPYQREREQKRLESERAAAEARRKAEEEARAEEERAREAEEEARRKKQQEDAAAQNQLAVTEAGYFQMDNRLQESSAAAPPEMGEGDSVAEIKAMLEKVKAFQSKDPSLFRKLWNDMRQPEASTTLSSIPSPLAQLAHQSLPLTTAQIRSTPAPLPLEVNSSAQSTTTPSGSSKRKKATWVGPEGHLLRANGYPAIVENNPEGLPDLGRFPAERRIRPNKYKKHHKGGSLDESAPSPTGEAGLEPPAFAGATPTPAPPNNRLSFSSQKGQVAPTAVTGVSGGDATTPSRGPPLKQHSGTVWPVEKWNALTNTALRFLKSNPENASIPLAEEDVHKMLENNPSYINLCEMLEQRGLKFHRGHFARELLDSVPDLKPSSSQPQAQKPAPAPAASNSQRIPAPALPSQLPPAGGKLVPVAGPAPAPATAPAPAPALPPPGYGQDITHPAATEHPPATAAYKTPKAKNVSTRPVPAPGSKEAAARKRDFSELIDLTEIDDENYVVPDKHPRLDGQDSDVEMEDNHFQAFPQQVLSPVTQPKAPPSNGWFGPNPQPVRFDPYVASTGQPKKQDTVAEAKASRLILAKTLDKNEALKKQYYDPRTVARDVLIASGRHPSERPLNVHLAGMLGKYIELDSDVSTFEWDEIDPGGPPLPKEEYVDVPASRPRYKMGDRMPRRLKTRHKVDKTRRPDQEKRDQPAPHSTAWPPAQQPLPQPGGPQAIRIKTQKPSGLRYSLLASDEHATPATLDPTRTPIVPSETKQTAPTVDQPSMDQTPSVRKRGRPPGSKNKYSNVGSLKDQAAAMAAVRINIPPRDPHPNPSARENFKCKWRKCSTVLHNLDTLKRHVEKIHSPSKDDLDSEGYTCWWKKCPHLKQSDTGEWIATHAFKRREEWLAHIEREHITPIALKHGDGPSTIHTGKQS